MKLLQDAPGSHHTVTGYGSNHVFINKVRHDQSLVVLPDILIDPWNASFDTLSIADFNIIIEARPEVVLLGTGPHQRFPALAVLQALMAARIGIEVMDMAAACRTYNILVGEGRRAAAALLIR